MRTVIALTLSAILSLVGPMVFAAESFIALDRAQARQLTNAATHSAPIIIALWSTECQYCPENLRLYVRMAKASPGLRLITIAAEQSSAELAVHLGRLKVHGKKYAYGSEEPEAIAFAIDPAWRGELPRTLFFDGRGGRTAISGLVDENTARRHLGRH